MTKNQLIYLCLLSCLSLTTLSCTHNAAPAQAGVNGTDTPEQNTQFRVLVDSFADIQILRYQVPGFAELEPRQKEMLYYLYEAAQSGRDILYDQHYKYNLVVRRTLDAIINTYAGDRQQKDFQQLLTYAKRVWFSHGIHHHYSGQKFIPKLSQESFAQFINAIDAKQLPLQPLPNKNVAPTREQFVTWLMPIIYDKKVAAWSVNRSPGVDLVQASSNHFYAGVTQEAVAAYYAEKSAEENERPVLWGLNSQLVKDGDKLVERTWRLGGMYGESIEKIIFWLEKAANIAENDKQKAALTKLIEFYKTGDLKTFDEYSIAWVNDTDSRIDVVNGFIETYGDALGYRGSFESVVSIRDIVRTKRISTIGGAAQWFEDHSPIATKHKKSSVVGISAKVITVVSESGDSAPSTPIGINLPNSDWIRKEHGSKSVFLGNIGDAYETVSRDSGVLEAFSFSPEEVKRGQDFGGTAYTLEVDMHEVIGHASGQLEPGVDTPESTLKAYSSALEEARADLVALYYVMDPKLIELGLMPSLEVGKAAYDGYIRVGLLTQLARILPGEDIKQSHMRNRQMISGWAFEKGKKDGVIEKVQKDGNFYFVVRDYNKLRNLFGQLLKEVQRVKSSGDYEAGKHLIETYGVKVDQDVHKNVLTRYAKLNVKPYSGFIQPKLVPVREGENIVDVKIEFPDDFVKQMLYYGKKYSFLPTFNDLRPKTK